MNRILWWLISIWYVLNMLFPALSLWCGIAEFMSIMFVHVCSVFVPHLCLFRKIHWMKKNGFLSAWTGNVPKRGVQGAHWADTSCWPPCATSRNCAKLRLRPAEREQRGGLGKGKRGYHRGGSGQGKAGEGWTCRRINPGRRVGLA